MSWRQDSHRIEAYPLVAYHGQGCDVCDFGSVFAHNDTVLGGQALEAQRRPRVRRVSLGTEDGGSGFSVSGLPMKNVAPLGESLGFSGSHSWQLLVSPIPAQSGHQEWENDQLVQLVRM